MTRSSQATRMLSRTRRSMARFRSSRLRGFGNERPRVTVEWATLIGRVAEGDREAFRRLFEHFAPRVKGLMLRAGASRDDAEEIAQETLLAVWRKAAQFDPVSAGAPAWIYTIARNLKIARALSNLSEEQSMAIRLSFIEERPHPEIAESLGIPLGTVKSRIRLAMNRLRVLLDAAK
jgi:DNA-directed RNA polymerase specialized sigma24 family protein